MCSGTGLTRRRFLSAGAFALGAAAGCRPVADSHSAGKTLTVWHVWGGVQAPRVAQVAAAYEKAHPGIRLRMVFTRNDLSSNQKFFTAVAARTPPDVIFVDGPQVASWAEWGSLEPLTERIRSEGIQASDYFPPTWAQNVYKGEVWALTYCADPNFAFAWNKEAFRSAGLNPDQPPTTIAELTEMSNRLTRMEGSVMRRIGIIPWEQYGPANSMFTWGWVFGGSFYTPETHRITADHPRNVAALEWMASFARRYDPSRIQSIREGIGAAEQDPFYTGRLAMRTLHIAGLQEISRYAPNLEFGLTFIPAPPEGEQKSSWVGGWCLGMPKGCRQPEEAWEFIRWLCHSPEGTTAVGRAQRLFPGMRHSPYFEEVAGGPHYGQFVRILQEARHQRPVMPVQALYMREMQRAVDAAVYGRKTPARALADARRNTQAELDLVLAG